MRRCFATAISTAAVLAAGVLSTPASAMPLTPQADGTNLVQQVAICFYVDGWNGPGLYECGYHHRQGLGWHGRRDGDRNQGRVENRKERGEGRGEQRWQGRGEPTEGRGGR